jgi:hypothetical protein
MAISNSVKGDVVGYRGIILTTKIQPHQGIDVDLTKFAREYEVILPRGTYKVKYEDNKTLEDKVADFGSYDAALNELLKNYKPSHGVMIYTILSKVDADELSKDTKGLIYDVLVKPERTHEFKVEIKDVYTHTDYPDREGDEISLFDGVSVIVKYNLELDALIEYKKFLLDEDYDYVIDENFSDVKNVLRDIEKLTTKELESKPITRVGAVPFFNMIKELYPRFFNKNSDLFKYIVGNYESLNSKSASREFNKKLQGTSLSDKRAELEKLKDELIKSYNMAATGSRGVERGVNDPNPRQNYGNVTPIGRKKTKDIMGDN